MKGWLKRKPNPNTNQIGNKEFKEHLADTALSVLLNMQKLTEDDFAGIKAEFGYLLMIENHGLEALFKIIKDENVYYFAAQQETLRLLEIDENLYRSTVEHMLELHT